jgi:hypothetical protein
VSSIATSTSPSVLSRLSAPPLLHVALLLYGVSLAAVSVNRLDRLVPDRTNLMGTRSDGAADSMRVLEAGGPPLLGCENGYDESQPLDRCYPVGVTDDQGLYLYLPLLAQAADLESPQTALKWLYIVLFALLALVSPLIFYGLFGSVVAALFAPAAIVFHFDLFVDTDIYWISGWCFLLALPLLLLVYERWGRYSPYLLAGVVAIGSFATSIRIHSGLPILLGALVVAVLRRKTLAGLGATILLLCVAYLAFAGVLTGAREYRDHAVGDPGLSERYPTRHPFWHNAYIGLGYLPNRYGIEWNDSISTVFVERKDPDAGYLTERYEQILRDEWFRIARQDPGLVVRNVLAKLGLAFDAARDRFGVVLLLAPLALFVGAQRRRWRRWLLIVAPGLVLSLPPSLLTMPQLQYQLGWLGAWGALWLLLACWALTVLPGEIRSKLEASRASGHGRARSIVTPVMLSPATWVAVGLVALVVVLADVVGPRAAQAVTAEDLWSEDADEIRAPARDDAFAQWMFAGAIAPDWATTEGVTLEPTQDGVEIATTAGRSEYQITGPVVLLSPGRYELRADVTVGEGGLELGVLNADADSWLAQSRYWYGQPGFGSRDLVAPFELSKPLRVKPVMSNWRHQSGTSWWLVRRIWLRRA